jgi:integrase
VRAGSQKNTRRKKFIGHDVVSRILEALPDNLWRLAFILGRYGGLRIPSEFQRLTWSDIDWAARKITVRVPKKEHLDGHESRFVPIFPEIEPYLRQAFEDAPEGSVFILPERFHQDGYVYAGILRAVERAGIPKWPKLLVNLRASRETELMRQQPAHLVHAWLGNSREVAEDHYLMATDEDFLRAAGKVTPTAPPASLITARHESSPEKETAVSPAFAKDTAVQIPPRGIHANFLRVFSFGHPGP